MAGGVPLQDAHGNLSWFFGAHGVILHEPASACEHLLNL
jgi:hypothetical protein